MAAPPARSGPAYRPRNIAEFMTLMREEPPAAGLPTYTPLPSDVLIATFPKCGTTWAQQIVHGLRTGGSMAFEEISLVVPWIETADWLGIDLDALQEAVPRAFKTHLLWEDVPKGARYIYIMRDPGDAMLSYYHFLEGWQFERGSVSVDEFCLEFYVRYLREEGYWPHLRSWWEQRDREDVLFLCFEDMKHDLEGAVRRVAAFIGVQADEVLIALSTRQATFEFMRAHQGQFDGHPTTLEINRQRGLPPDGRTTKVRAGRVGDSVTLSPMTRAALERAWRRWLEPLGAPSYAALRALLAEGTRT